MEFNPGPEPSGWPRRPSTDQHRPPCPHRPPRLHLREDLLCVSVYRCRTRALDCLFKNQTVIINDVNTKKMPKTHFLRRSPNTTYFTHCKLYNKHQLGKGATKSVKVWSFTTGCFFLTGPPQKVLSTSR